MTRTLPALHVAIVETQWALTPVDAADRRPLTRQGELVVAAGEGSFVGLGSETTLGALVHEFILPQIVIDLHYQR